jgi:hypothetical protein
MRVTVAKVLAAMVFAFAAASEAQAGTISLTPTSGLLIGSGLENTQSAIDAKLYDLLGDLDLVYKDEDSGEEGTFKDSYSTIYKFPGLAAKARISYSGAPLPTLSGALYALMKDGKVKNPAPYQAWYLFDISGWDGTSNIDFTGFYGGNQGRISHVSIYQGPAPTAVPDGGSIAMLLGMALIGLAGLRRMVS